MFDAPLEALEIPVGLDALMKLAGSDDLRGSGGVGEEVEEVFHVDERILVDFEEEADAAAEPRRPLQPHQRLQCQIAVRVDKVLLPTVKSR